jgi:hypothetical protein
VLFLPEGELHELGLLFAYYLLKSRNHEVLYLGQSMPLRDLFAVVEIFKPHYVFGIFNINTSSEVVDTYFDNLIANIPHGRVLASGSYFIEKDTPNSDKFLRMVGIKDFMHFLDHQPEYEA